MYAGVHACVCMLIHVCICMYMYVHADVHRLN